VLEVNSVHETYNPQNDIKCIRACYCHLLMPTSATTKKKIQKPEWEKMTKQKNSDTRNQGHS